MAVAFQTSSSGNKTVTSGTTFTMALSSTAGDAVIVAVNTHSNTITVSSVTDGGGNQYDRVNSVVNGTTIGIELWKTRAVNPSASGTLTVTLSASGQRASGVCASYRGVAFAGEAATTHTQTSGSITSGSITLRETLGTGELILVGGQAAANTYTQSSGNLRVQTSTTSNSVMLADSEGSSSPVTVTVTMTSAAHGEIWFELRPLVITESITLSEALVLGYGDLLTDTESANWLETGPVLASSMNLGIPEAVSDNGGANWLDAGPVVANHTLVMGLVETVSDDESANWLDALRVGYGNAVVDQLTMSDSMLAGYGALNSDQLVIADSMSAGYGALLSDNLNNWLDAEQNLLGIAEAFSDTMTMSDFVAAGYGAATSDQLVISDSLGAGYGGLLSDNLNNWADSASNITLGYNLKINQNLNQWADLSALLLAGALAFSDQMVMSDFMAAGYGSGTSDQLVIVDSLNAGYGAVLSDTDAANWLDSVLEVLSIAETLTDNLNNWADFMAAGYGSATSDQLVIVDSLGAGYGGLLSDNLNNWLDSASNITLGYSLRVNQNMNQWLEAFAFNLASTILTEVLSDNLNNWADFVAAGYGALNSDQLVISDSLGAGYGGLLSDTLNNWLDSESNILGMNELAADTLTMSDFMSAGYGAATSDQIVIVDSLGAGYGAALSDNLNNWLDSFAEILFGTLIQIQFTESMNNWLDFLGAGYGALNSDQLILVESVGAGYGALLSDSDAANWADSVLDLMSIAATLSDNLNNWTDRLGVGYGDVLAEQLAMNDFTAAGYGAGTSDQLVIVDSLGAGYGALLSDTDAANWLDAFQYVASITEALSDTLTFSDRLGLGYGNTVGDQVNWADQLGVGYGMGVTESGSMLDAMGLGYGMFLTDSMNFLLDAVIAGGVSVESLILSDSAAAFWADRLDSLLVGGVGPALVYKAQARPKVIFDNIAVTTKVADYAVKTAWKLAFDEIKAELSTLVYETKATPSMLLNMTGKKIQPYLLSFSENLSNWGDMVPSPGNGIPLQFTESLNFWAELVGVNVDTVGGGVGLALTDAGGQNWADMLVGFIN